MVMLAAIYGLQALVFIFRMRWDMIAWMVCEWYGVSPLTKVYILAIPVFSFFLPLYSFWKMDDFSWGSTRLVVGDKGKKLVIHDEGKFDPKAIPLQSWNDYENELWDNESNHSGTWDGGKNKSEYLDDGNSRTASVYGHPQSMYGQQSYGRGSMYQGSFAGARSPHSPQGLSPSASYSDLRGASRAGSHLDAPLRGTFYAQRGDTGGDTGSMYGTGSFYGQRASVYEQGPSESELDTSIRRICASADLDTLTKKGVRKQLEAEFGLPLGARKDTINRIIEAVLAE